MLCPCHSIADLHELLDGIPNLLIQDAAVGDNNNGIQHRMSIQLKSNELMGKPCDRVGFSAACTVLNEILFPDAVCFHICKEFCNHIQLMIARKNLLFLFLLRLLIDLNNHLGIVLDDE